MILTNRMMYGVEAQLAQQRRRLRIAALHVQRRPFTAFLIIFAQFVELARNARDFSQRRIIAAHIIHQMRQPF